MDFKFGALLIISAQICAALAASPSPCACTKELRPVCGSDNVTYANACVLRCAAFESGKDIKLVKLVACNEPTEQCICPDVLSPVCGTDGQTYPNECGLKCHSARSNSSVEVAHKGRCVPPKEGDCFCPAVFMPVCGSDGKTYGNECVLGCAAKTTPKLKVAHKKPCAGDVMVKNI